MRFRFVAPTTLCVFVACATGNVGDQDGALSPDGGGGVPDSGAETSLVLEAGPSVFDGGPPATIGGDDGGDSGADAGADGADATSPDAEADASNDAADANVSCGSPNGSYSSTCSSCTFVGVTLNCNCLTDSQASVAASLDLCSCTQPPVIANTNGVLTCP